MTRLLLAFAAGIAVGYIGNGAHHLYEMIATPFHGYRPRRRWWL